MNRRSGLLLKVAIAVFAVAPLLGALDRAQVREALRNDEALAVLAHPVPSEYWKTGVPPSDRESIFRRELPAERDRA